jgi:OFA family oxalate/formate antiporter-like MFS transporter
LAGFAGPYTGGLLKDITGTYYVPFAIGAAMAAVSVILLAIVKPPVKLSLGGGSLPRPPKGAQRI